MPSTFQLSSWSDEGIDITPWLGETLSEVRGIVHGSEQCALQRRDRREGPATATEVHPYTELCEHCWNAGYTNTEYELAERVEDALHFHQDAERTTSQIFTGEFPRWYQSLQLIPGGELQYWTDQVRADLTAAYTRTLEKLPAAERAKILHRRRLGESGPEGLLLFPHGIRFLARAPEYGNVCALYWQPENSERLLLKAPRSILERLEAAAEKTLQPREQPTRCNEVVEGEVLEVALSLYDPNSKSLSRLPECVQAAERLLAP